MGSPNDPGHPDAPESDTRPYLCIPYWTTPMSVGGTWDTGQNRPLPAAVVSYACESIRTGPYTPGVPLDVTVDVRNSGGGNSAAIATVAVYWADPTVGFTAPKFFAAAAVPVPPSRGTSATASTPTMTATIPASAPAHVCLLAVVTHSQDRPGPALDPVHDRHYAQRNLQAVTAQPGTPTTIPFQVGNPFPSTRTFDLRIGPADERRARRVSSLLQAEVHRADALLRLLDESGTAISDDGTTVSTRMELEAGAHRPLQLVIDIADGIPSGTSVPLEAALIEPGRGRDPVGSLGVVLLPE